MKMECYFISSLLATTASVLLVVFLFVLFARFISRKWKYHTLIEQLPRGPWPLPFVGSALSFMGRYDLVLQLLQIEWPLAYGDIFRVFIGSDCNVCISSPELMEQVLKSQKILDKGNVYKFFRPWLGDGLLLSTDGKWKARRRLLTPAFHFQILDDFIEIFNKESHILCKLMDKHLQLNEQSKEIDVYPFMANCSLDIICATAMGVSINAQSQESDYTKAVYRINQIVVERFSKPWFSNDRIFRAFSISREHSQLLNTLHTFTENVIEKRKAQRAETMPQIKLSATDESHGDRVRRVLLDILLEAKSDENDIVLNDRDIREEIDTFMFEGHDTTTSTSAWFLYCMAINQEHQEKVWDELQEVFGESNRNCSMQDFNNLPYLECCIKESLRLYSSVPHIERHVKEDFQLGEYLIPAGCNIILLLYGIHHNPRVYPNPWTYDPERFLPDETRGRHPYAYIPFSAGPRNCIGQRFALMEVKVVVSTFLRRFKVAVSPLSAKPIPSMQSVLKPMDGIHLILSRR